MADPMQPNNAEAERAVLGGLLIDPPALFKLTDFLRSQDFYQVRHQWIYEAICGLVDRNVALDFITLSDELERQGHLTEIGGAAYLSKLVGSTPTSYNIVDHARLVESLSRDRTLIRLGQEMVKLGFDGEVPTEEKEDRAQQMLLDATNRGDGRQTTLIKNAVGAYYEHVVRMSQTENKIVGLTTGIPKLDWMLLGLQKGRMYILAGRPGMGKSALAMNIAYHAASMGHHVGVFTLEMSDLQLVNRWVAGMTGIDSRRLFSGNLRKDEWTAFIKATGELSEKQIFINDVPGISVLQLRNTAKRWMLAYGLDLLIVDYLQLMQAEGLNRNYNRENEVRQISWGVKVLVKELGIPGLIVCQLSRAVEARRDKHPMLSDLRESGSLEQDADGVMFLYREDYYDSDTDRPHITDLDVAKQRDGPTGRIPLFFKEETTTFVEVELEKVPLNGYSELPPPEESEPLAF